MSKKDRFNSIFKMTAFAAGVGVALVGFHARDKIKFNKKTVAVSLVILFGAQAYSQKNITPPVNDDAKSVIEISPANKEKISPPAFTSALKP